ncbi:MAG: DinB family protein [Chitinophagaceae bacterium]|jgi:uncharacterized damage-inducible protein DinB|nr:DinB family protein [Chitinophagaceae bacterium]
MIDPNFIEQRVKRGIEAKEKVSTYFSNLSIEQFNWKPSDEKWSIAECIQHLLIADQCYFKDLTEIGNGLYQMTPWERYSPLTRVWGKFLKDQMKEIVKKKLVTHKLLTPTSSAYSLALLTDYNDNLSSFIKLVRYCKNVDLDRTVINSPTIKWITYSLRDALEFLFEHEHRHLNQAISLMNMEGFPKANNKKNL